VLSLLARTALIFVGVLAVASCAGGGSSSSSSSTPSSAPSGAPSSAASASSQAADAGGAKGNEKAFAGSTSEATELISAAVDKKHSEISACVREFRARKKGTQNRVAVSFGIDQEGRLLGVTSKGAEDAAFKACIQDALKTATFPRSHAGVITVTKSYEDIVQ
jgi:hypothetical protein